MEIKKLYMYIRPDGGTTVSLMDPGPDVEYETLYRLIADEGMGLSKGEVEDASVIDTVDTDGWIETALPALEEEPVLETDPLSTYGHQLSPTEYEE